MFKIVGKVYNPKKEELEVRTCYCYFDSIQDTIVVAGFDFSEGHYVNISVPNFDNIGGIDK